MSGPYAPRDSQTVRRSDGNVETTTQVRTKYEEDVEVSFGAGQLDSRYCCRPSGILRLVEMVSRLISARARNRVYKRERRASTRIAA